MKLPITIWLPVLVILAVATIAGSLGVIFIVLYGTLGESIANSRGHDWQATPVIILGLAIVVLVPLIAALVHQKLGPSEEDPTIHPG